MIRRVAKLATGAACVTIVIEACFAPPGMSAAWAIWGGLAVIAFTMIATPAVRSWQKARDTIRDSQIWAERVHAAETAVLTPKQFRTLRAIEAAEGLPPDVSGVARLADQMTSLISKEMP